MKKLNDIRIGLRLSLLITISVIVIIGLLGAFIVYEEIKYSQEAANERMLENVKNLDVLISTNIASNQRNVKVGIGAADLFLKNLGSINEDKKQLISITAINQVSKESIEVEVPKWSINGIVIQNDEEIVDGIRDVTGGTVTVFQRIDEGFLRIATNVIAKNGKRATGTYIPNSSNVIKTVLKGETFVGRAFVVDDWYLTSYRPLVVNGSIQGIIYVGVKEKNLDQLRSIFLEKTFFDSGYAYIVDKEGVLIIHATNEGGNVSDRAGFKKIIETTEGYGTFSHKEDGRNVVEYFKYVKEINSYVVIRVFDDELYARVYFLRNIVILSLIVSVLVLSLIIYLITKNISNSISKAVTMAQSIAKGQLSEIIDIDQKDEIGMLAKALNSMVKGLQEVVTEIQQGADKITFASVQLSGSSQQLSEGANEQASSIEEVSSTMEEISSSIHQNSDNATKTSMISIDANAGSQRVSEHTKEMISANEEIAQKISVINDIAMQTNILALNASVESARAGVHGRGFAVVAAEVRKLAEQSKSAAEEIIELTRKGLERSALTGQVIDEIIPKINETSILVQEIAASSLEQNNGASQINNAMQLLNDVTQENAASSEELSASAEELASQANRLKESIGFFKL